MSVCDFGFPVVPLVPVVLVVLVVVVVLVVLVLLVALIVLYMSSVLIHIRCLVIISNNQRNTEGKHPACLLSLQKSNDLGILARVRLYIAWIFFLGAQYASSTSAIDIVMLVLLVRVYTTSASAGTSTSSSTSTSTKY
jgi:hypothetical protein